MKKQRFFICKHCGNLIELDMDKGGQLVCCNDKMTELIPNTVEASAEKHLPVYKIEKDIVHVMVGSVEHPMTVEHNIVFIYVQTEQGGMKKMLKPGDKPVAEFCVYKDKPIAVYEFCNLHGLWMTEIK